MTGLYPYSASVWVGAEYLLGRFCRLRGRPRMVGDFIQGDALDLGYLQDQAKALSLKPLLDQAIQESRKR